jgi:hypothetical protein
MICFVLPVSGQIDSVRHEAEQRWWLDQSKLRSGVMSPTKTHRSTMQALQLLKPLSPQLQLCFDIAGSSKRINKVCSAHCTSSISEESL